MHAFGAIRREPLQDGGMESNWASEAVKKLLAQAVALIELDARAVAGLL